MDNQIGMRDNAGGPEQLLTKGMNVEIVVAAFVRTPFGPIFELSARCQVHLQSRPVPFVHVCQQRFVTSLVPFLGVL